LLQLDFNAKDGKWSAGIAVTCRILLKNGSFHEVRAAFVGFSRPINPNH